MARFFRAVTVEVPPKREHQGALSGATNPKDLLLHVLSLISPAMAPAHRPVRRPNMSDCPAQKLPVTHQSPLSLAATNFATRLLHRSAAQVRPDLPVTSTSSSALFLFPSKIPVPGPLTLPLLDNGWALEVGVLATRQ